MKAYLFFGMYTLLEILSSLLGYFQKKEETIKKGLLVAGGMATIVLVTSASIWFYAFFWYGINNRDPDYYQQRQYNQKQQKERSYTPYYPTWDGGTR